MKQLIVERWTSDDKKEEVHLFIPGETNRYVLGFNPDVVDENKICELLDSLGLKMPAY